MVNVPISVNFRRSVRKFLNFTMLFKFIRIYFFITSLFRIVYMTNELDIITIYQTIIDTFNVKTKYIFIFLHIRFWWSVFEFRTLMCILITILFSYHHSKRIDEFSCQGLFLFFICCFSRFHIRCYTHFFLFYIVMKMMDIIDKFTFLVALFKCFSCLKHYQDCK